MPLELLELKPFDARSVPVVLPPQAETTACDICGNACTHGTCCTKFCKKCNA